MRKVYDNGEYLLGLCVDIKKYVEDNCYIDELMEEIIEDLSNYKDTDIIVLHYELPMGYNIIKFDEKDITN